MRKISFIILSVLALTSCEKPISPETAKAFVGEYWMKTRTTTYYNSSSIESVATESWSPVIIYEEGNKLYVQTDHYGTPDTDTTTGAPHGFILDYPDHPNYVVVHNTAIVDDEEEEDKGSGIEEVEVTGDPIIFLRNGKIWTLWKGIYLKSLPIKVKSGSETVLNLESYKPLEIVFTNAAGDSIGKAKAWYEYGPMVKKGDTITWDVEYKDDHTPSNGQEKEYDRIIHKNTLYKR